MTAKKSNDIALRNDVAEANRLLNLTEQIAHVGHWSLAFPDWKRNWSAETFRIFGLDPGAEAPGIWQRSNGYHIDDQDRVRALLISTAADRQDCRFEARVVRPDHEIRNVVVRSTCEIKNNKVRGLFGVIFDITEQRKAQSQVRESERRYRLLAEHTTDVIVLATLDSTRVYVSPASRQLVGYDPEELVGMTAYDLLHPDDQERFRDFLATFLAGNTKRAINQQRYRHKDGHYIWAETTYSAIASTASGQTAGYVAVVRDITDRHAAEAQAKHLAMHDSLTGLPNRTLFQLKLEHAFEKAQRSGTKFTLLWIDLDRFKAINDTFGHPAGDHLLQEIGGRITSALNQDHIVARITGDGFAILLNEAGTRLETQRVAQRVIDAIHRSSLIKGQTVNIGASIGIAFGPADGTNADVLCKNAGLALQNAKESGRNSSCFYEPPADVVEDDGLIIEMDLRDAITGGGLTLHYQPIVDIKTNKIVTCEALVRWEHPTRGSIPPGRFIPAAEESELIIPLGNWVLREACREAAAWPDGIQVAVNVSVCQLRRPGFEESVASALAASGLLPSRLELEITESILIANTDAVLASLRRLRLLGVKTSLDDFGTGYSSLSYLHRFPFDTIKIDRCFVQAMNEQSAYAVVRLIADLGTRLSIVITAEGIETPLQLQEVQAAGCTQYQGFLFSRAISAQAISALLSQQELPKPATAKRA